MLYRFRTWAIMILHSFLLLLVFLLTALSVITEWNLMTNLRSLVFFVFFFLPSWFEITRWQVRVNFRRHLKRKRKKKVNFVLFLKERDQFQFWNRYTGIFFKKVSYFFFLLSQLFFWQNNFLFSFCQQIGFPFFFSTCFYGKLQIIFRCSLFIY